jgi:hypothetical protein
MPPLSKRLKRENRMRGEPVLNKTDMYRRLKAGEFGNTNPNWHDWQEWTADPNGRDRYELWGIRSMTANDPRAKLNVHRADVFAHLEATGLLNDGYSLSPMLSAVSRIVTWEGNVQRNPTLLAEGNVAVQHGSWRTHMLHPRVWEGSAADVLLRWVLNPSSYADLMTLLDLYPEHVVEFTALDVEFGTHPGHNAIVWEVRRY